MSHAATRSAAAPAAPAVAATKGLQLLAYACLSTTNILVQCWPGKLLVSAQQPRRQQQQPGQQLLLVLGLHLPCLMLCHDYQSQHASYVQQRRQLGS